MFIFASPKQTLEERIAFEHGMELARQRWTILKENLAERQAMARKQAA